MMPATSSQSCGRSAEQFFNVARFVANPGEHGHVGTAGEARFAPVLNGDATDEAETPLTAFAESLDFLCRFEESVRASRTDCRPVQRHPDIYQ